MTKYSLVLISFLITSLQLIASQPTGNHPAKDSASENSKNIKVNALVENNTLNWYQMVADVPRDDYLFITKSFTGPNVSAYVTIAALTGALMRFDKSGWRYENRLYKTSYAFRNTSNVFEFLGNGGSHFILSGLFAAYGLAEHDESALRTASNIVEAELSAGLLVQVLKRITGRESPAGSDKTLGDWKFFPSIKEYQKDQPKYYSFPSGHMAAAAAVLTVVANDNPQCTWIRPAGYCALGILGISLVSEGMHWYSDLPLGFFIGYSIGNIVAPEIKTDKDHSSSKTSQVIIMPNIGYNNLGLSMSYTF